MMRFRILCVIWFILLATMVSASEIHDATDNSDLAELKKLAGKGVDINEVDFIKGSALHIAAAQGNAEIVAELINLGADVQTQEFGKDDTPLHRAALSGSTAVVQLLLEAGAEINALNDIQKTPLHVAAESANFDAAVLLIESGADLDQINVFGDAAMHLAGKANALKLVDVFLANGAQWELSEYVSPLLTTADPSNGKNLWGTNCQRCHTVQKAGEHDVGPALWDIVGKEKATFSDYEYTEAFKRAIGTWDYEELNALLLDSRNFYPGTKMYGYVKNVKDRADIIAFLRLQSDDPVPLPE